jgi:hypothetical protein
VPHAPFHNICFGDTLPPFTMWLAFPTSDYYGGSVAIPNFQRHLSWLFTLKFITLWHYA